MNLPLFTYHVEPPDSHREFSTRVVAGEGVHTGWWAGRHRDGPGVCLYASGDAFAGWWSGDQRHGWGLFVRAHGSKYEGVWQSNKQTGLGVLAMSHELRYLGQFRLGRKHGRGVLLQLNGLLYAGEWQDGEPVSRELLFQQFESDTDSGPDESASSSPSSSSSTSSTPVFASSRSPRGDHFVRRFRVVQRSSDVHSLPHWTAAEVAYFLTACGLQPQTAELFLKHQVSGPTTVDILTNPEEHLLDIGIENAYVRRFIALAFLKLHRVRRRCESQQRKPVDKSVLNCISTKGLYLERRVGEGGYGRVYRGRYEFGGGGKPAREGSIPVAVKVFRSRTTSGCGPHDLYDRLQKQQRAMVKDFNAEVAILSKLRHPNVTLFLGAVTFPIFCIVTEYVPCGSLFDLLHRHRRPLSFAQLIRIAREICCAGAYLHSQGILHCDLKSSNVLLNELGAVKLCDFGLATRRAELDEPAILGCIGTHQWMAPEVMRGEEFSTASDVYSFGVILWEMLSREIPYREMPLAHITAWVGYAGMAPYQKPSQDVLGSLPEPIRVLLLRCLSGCPAKRPSFSVLCHLLERLNDSSVLDIEENLKSFFGVG